MPVINEIRAGRQLGYNRGDKWVWLACSGCGKERWVQLKQDKPKYDLCKSCVQKGNRNRHWGQEKIGRKRRTIAGYIYIYKPDHPQSEICGYVARSHLVFEENYGRYVGENMVVHHLNGIRDDDRPENLLELSNSEHGILHAKLKAE